jgi:hypothetical protein
MENSTGWLHNAVEFAELYRATKEMLGNPCDRWGVQCIHDDKDIAWRFHFLYPEDHAWFILVLGNTIQNVKAD